MHAIAQYGLGLSIVTSALGAFLLCLLVLRYGFAPPDEEAPDERYRRHFVTRLGHAAGAVCFAISAGLAAVVLGSPAPRVDSPAPAAAVTPAELATLRSENERLGDFVHTLTTRLDEAETAVQRLRATSTDTGAKVDRLERIANAPRPAPTVTRPVPPAPRAASTPVDPAPAPIPPPVARDARRSALTERDAASEIVGRTSLTVGTRLPALSTAPAMPAAPPVVSATPPPTSAPAAPPPLGSSDQPTAASIDTVVISPPVEPTSTAAASAPRLPTFRKSEPDALDTAVRGIVRLGDSVRRGLLNAGQTVRRFVEDLQ